MAYNTLSGTVEFAGANGSLENTVRTDDSIQTIDGRKTFLQRITASAITLNGTNLVPPVISSVTNAAATRVAFFNGAAGLEGHTGLVYTAAGGLTASYFSGSGRGITHLRGDRFTTTISASNIKFGNGLMSDSGVLVVSGGAGINVTATGVKPNLDTYGGLNLNTTTLMLDAGQTYDISNGGQSLATGDKLFVQDVAGASPAAPALRSMTVGTLATYLQSNLTFSPITAYTNEANHRIIAGTATGGTVNGLAALTFDGSKLAVIGDVSGSGTVYTKKLTSSFGAVVSNSVGVNTNAPAYEIHAKGNDASVFADGDNNAYFRLGIGGAAKGYLQVIGATSDIVLGNTTSNADVILGAKVAAAQTTMLRLDGGRGAMTASVPLSCSLSVSASYFYGDGSQLTNLPGGGGISFNGSTANGLVTYANASTADVESNLTFDGTDLGVSDKIFHIGDTDTFINFTTDDINFQAGGVNFLDLTEDTQNEATFNEGGVDVDFRVESENDTHMLFVDAANDAVSIGVSTDAPAAVLEVVGDGAASKPTLTVIHAENTNNAVNITADSITTAKALNISADGLTTGNAIRIGDNSSNTGTRQTALIVQNDAAALNATALTVQSDGGVTGVNLDKNYSDLTEASIVGLNIDFDKTGASTSDNNMYGIQLDMDNTTATNGNNYMYGLHVTPTLTHAADAGGSFVYGAHISAQGGTNGSSLVQGARIEAAGGDFNYGIQLDVEDGPNNVDLRIESSADNGDYFQIQTTTAGATTITTVDDNAAAAHLTFTVDGDINLNPAGTLAIKTVEPTIHFSSSGGASLGRIGMNSSDNILIQNDTINKHIVFKVNDNGTTREGFRLNGAVPEVVVNEGSESLVDFRVEGDTNPHTLFVKGSTNRVGIGTGDPQAITHITSDTSGGTVLAIQQSNDGTDAPNIDFKKSRGDFGGPAAVQPNDFLSQVSFKGWDGSAYASHADIYVQAGTPIGGSSHPGKIVIRTVPANSTTLTTAVTIDENQKTTINGSLRAKQLHTTVHNFANNQASAFYIPFLSTVESTTPGYLQQYMAPANGRLVKAIVRTTNGQSGSIAMDVMIAGDGVTTFSSGPSSVAERVTVTMTARDTAYTFATSGSNHFASADLVGVRIDPQSSPGNVNMTCVWEYDFTTT